VTRELTLRQACQAVQQELMKLASWREIPVAENSEPALCNGIVIMDAIFADGIIFRAQVSLSGEWSSIFQVESA
jgi:hypothetical protein